MANRSNRARELGPGVGSATSNTDNAYFIDLANGTFAQVGASYTYIKQGGVWIAWDGSLQVGTIEIGKVDQGLAGVAPWLVTQTRASTATVTSIADSASNQTLLAANTARFGATVYNDSTVVLYLKLGATATSSSFTAKLQPDGYYEVPAGYTGQIDGLWASDASGSARITELS